MPEDPQQPRKMLTRRRLLSLAVLSAGGIAGGMAVSQRPPSGPDNSPAPMASPPAPTAPAQPALADRDPLLLTRLERTDDTSGALTRFEGAFLALKVKDVIPMPGLNNSVRPWLAVSIVGPVSQLQILSPETAEPVHVLTLPESHNGGIESPVWDQDNKILYLCSAATLFSWDSTSPKQVRSLGKVPKATTLYDLQLDSTGNVWGGTYPNGATFSYTVASKKIRAHSRVAADTDYIRRVAVGPDDQIWVGTGSRNPRLFTFSAKKPNMRSEVQLPEPMHNGFISSINIIGDRVAVTASDINAQLLLDRKTRKWVGSADRVWASRRISTGLSANTPRYTISKGTLYATDTTTWQDTALGAVSTSAPLAIYATAKEVLVASQIPTGLRIEVFSLVSNSVGEENSAKLATGEFKIQSLMGHSDGNIYVGGYMGQGLASINADTGARWRSPDDQQVINQIEAMIEFDRTRSYIGSYGSADIISMRSRQKDTAQGYERLGRLSTEYHQSRPFGWATNTKNVFFGTVPDYGRAGGVIGMINPDANTIDWVLDGNGQGFIKAHSIIGLVADDRFLYGTSSVRNGYGIPDTTGPAKVFKLEIATQKKVWESTPVKNSGALYAPKLIAGWLVVADIEGINIIDPANGKLVKRHKLTSAKNAASRPGWANADIAQVGNGSKIVHSAAGTTSVVDFQESTIATIGSPEGKARFGSRLAATPTGRVFGYTENTVVVELDLDPRRKRNASEQPATSPTATRTR